MTAMKAIEKEPLPRKLMVIMNTIQTAQSLILSPLSKAIAVILFNLLSLAIKCKKKTNTTLDFQAMLHQNLMQTWAFCYLVVVLREWLYLLLFDSLVNIHRIMLQNSRS